MFEIVQTETSNYLFQGNFINEITPKIGYPLATAELNANNSLNKLNEIRKFFQFKLSKTVQMGQQDKCRQILKYQWFDWRFKEWILHQTER